MIKHLTFHSSFTTFLKAQIADLSPSDRKRLYSGKFRSALSKVKLLNFDPVHHFLRPLYASRGRPAIHQIEILRSLFLMLHFGYSSIDTWVQLTQSDALFALLCGFDPNRVAPLGSYYDLINRLWPVKDYNRVFPKDRYAKPSSKPKKGAKWENNPLNATSSLAQRYLDHHFDLDRPELLLQYLFLHLAVLPSFNAGLFSVGSNTLSGDGSCLHIHSNPRGHHTDDENLCRYSDPSADFGWDSDLNAFYFGHTFYSLALHNANFSIDLPLFFTLVPASQHDSLTGISALAQFKNIFPAFHISHLCLDSAHDNSATFNLCNHWGITPVIDLNKRNSGHLKYNDTISLDEHLRPVCQAGHPMTYDGYCKSRCRHKFRCPLKTGKISDCPCQTHCSTSDYGRVVYIKSKDDPRFASPILHDSEKWKEIYKNRTSCERINTRVLNDYNIQNLHIHTKRRFFFFTMMACINIHFDARIKVLEC